MATELTTTNSTRTAIDFVRLSRLVAALYGTIEKNRKGEETLPSLPSSDERKELTERRRELNAKLRVIGLARAEQDRVRGAISLFLSGYLNARTNDVDSTSRAYLAQLLDQPLFAIMAALDDFRNRRVFDIGSEGQRIPFTIDHAPSAFRLLDQVKKCAEDVQVEHYQIGKVLAITKTSETPLVSPEEAARVADSLAKLAGGMLKRVTKIAEADRQKNREEAQAARDRAQRIIQDAKSRNAERDAASQEQALG
jgi:hypothetical protein